MAETPKQTAPPARSTQEAALPKPAEGQKQADAGTPDIQVLMARLQALEEKNAVNDLTRDEVDPSLPNLSEAARVSAYPLAEEETRKLDRNKAIQSIELKDGEQVLDGPHAVVLRGYPGEELYLSVVTTYGNKYIKKYEG